MAKSEPTPHLRLRVRPNLLAELKAAASENRNTLTGEIIERLENSLLGDDKIKTVLGDARHAPVFRLLAGIIGVAELQSGKRWDKDDQTFVKILQQTGETLQSLSRGTATFQEKVFATAALAGHELRGGTPNTEVQLSKDSKDILRSIAEKKRHDETTKPGARPRTVRRKQSKNIPISSKSEGEHD